MCKTERGCLNPLSLTPSRLPRFLANGQNFKLLRKRERNGKDPSRASTKEMTVKLDFFLAICLVWKHFSKFPKTKLCQLASGQSFRVTCYAETGFKEVSIFHQISPSALSVFLCIKRLPFGDFDGPKIKRNWRVIEMLMISQKNQTHFVSSGNKDIPSGSAGCQKISVFYIKCYK